MYLAGQTDGVLEANTSSVFDQWAPVELVMTDEEIAAELIEAQRVHGVTYYDESGIYVSQGFWRDIFRREYWREWIGALFDYRPDPAVYIPAEEPLSIVEMPIDLYRQEGFENLVRALDSTRVSYELYLGQEIDAGKPIAFVVGFGGMGDLIYAVNGYRDHHVIGLDLRYGELEFVRYKPRDLGDRRLLVPGYDENRNRGAVNDRFRLESPYSVLLMDAGEMPREQFANSVFVFHPSTNASIEAGINSVVFGGEILISYFTRDQFSEVRQEPLLNNEEHWVRYLEENGFRVYVNGSAEQEPIISAINRFYNNDEFDLERFLNRDKHITIYAVRETPDFQGMEAELDETVVRELTPENWVAVLEREGFADGIEEDQELALEQRDQRITMQEQRAIMSLVILALQDANPELQNRARYPILRNGLRTAEFRRDMQRQIGRSLRSGEDPVRFMHRMARAAEIAIDQMQTRDQISREEAISARTRLEQIRREQRSWEDVVRRGRI